MWPLTFYKISSCTYKTLTATGIHLLIFRFLYPFLYMLTLNECDLWPVTLLWIWHQSSKDQFSTHKYFSHSKDIYLDAVNYLWCDLGKSVGTRTCLSFSVFYLNEVLIWRGTFCWKPHLNQSSGSEFMGNWRILRTIEKRNSFLFLAISHNQCCQLLTDSASSQHIFHMLFFIFLGPQYHRKVILRVNVFQFGHCIHNIPWFATSTITTATKIFPFWNK